MCWRRIPSLHRMLCVVDLFSGCGGFSEGARQAGASVVLAVDAWKAALDAHALRHPDAEHWCEELGGDPAEFAGRLRARLASLPPGSHVHLHGSPPCQNLSACNPTRDVPEGLRLVIWYLDVVDALRPDSWTMEQVPNVQVLRLLELRGAPYRVLRFDKHGVPNTRRRVIAGPVDFDSLLCRPAPSARSVLAGLEDLSGAFTHLTGGSVRVSGCGYTPRCLDDVACTVTSHYPCLLDPSSGKSKVLGLPSLLALQSFPADYLTGAKFKVREARTMLGNAVSPAMARALVEAITVTKETDAGRHGLE